MTSGAPLPPPPPPSAYPGTVPPPPPPPHRRRSVVAVGVGALVAVTAFAAGVAVGARDDGDDRAENSSAATATSAAATPTAPGSTGSRPAESTPASNSSGTTTGDAPPASGPAPSTAPTTAGGPTTTAAPGPPVPFAAVAIGVYPADPAALRATLDTFGFPAWWPVPATVSAPSAPYPTVQLIQARDYVLDPGTSDAFGSGDYRTRWLEPTNDLAAIEAVYVAQVPADQFDVEGGVARKTTVTQSGVTETSYTFSAQDGLGGDYLGLTIEDAVTESGERIGTLVEFSHSVTALERPDPVPTGTAPGRQFLGTAPTSPETVWSATEVSVNGGLGTFETEPYGYYEATWRVAPDDVDAVITFLSDSANFTGDLKQVTVGRFTSDDLWEQPMDYQGFKGAYELYKSSGDDDNYLTLRFDLIEG